MLHLNSLLKCYTFKELSSHYEHHGVKILKFTHSLKSNRFTAEYGYLLRSFPIHCKITITRKSYGGWNRIYRVS